jgi:hypothetical protein
MSENNNNKEIEVFINKLIEKETKILIEKINNLEKHNKETKILIEKYNKEIESLKKYNKKFKILNYSKFILNTGIIIGITLIIIKYKNSILNFINFIGKSIKKGIQLKLTNMQFQIINELFKNNLINNTPIKPNITSIKFINKKNNIKNIIITVFRRFIRK